MSDTGKTITISKEAYLEIKRLNKENAALVEENYKSQMREEKYSKQAQKAFDKADAIQDHCDYMNDANAELIKRWTKLKDLFQISVDLYTDDDDIDVSMAQQAIDEMNKLEKV